MPISKDAFTEGFIQETNDHLDSITNEIISLKNTPKNKDVLSALLREIHTIKGTSRMLGYSNIEKIAHGIEDVFKGIWDEKYELTDLIIRLTFSTGDCIRKALEVIRTEGTDNIDIQIFLETYRKASAGLFFNADILEAALKAPGDGINPDSINQDNSEQEEKQSLENIRSIRIDIDRINEIIKSFDNLIIRQFRFKHQLENFQNKLLSAENAGIHKIPKQLMEDLLLTEDAIFDTQHLVLDLRMLPLDMVVTPLKRDIQNEAIKLGKNVFFDIPNADIMLDKVILEKLKEILLHLVRNSLDHGIESPEERREKGKDERGTISIHTTQISNYIIITVGDDGRGIQYDSIREKAIELYPSQRDEIMAMAEKDLQQYIFLSGFTTKKTTSELSGRGVGLDIVRTDMEKIKGKIHVKTEKDKGCTFELTIPLSLSTQQGLFIHSGSMKFMIPSHYIQEIIDIDSAVLLTMQGQKFINTGNQLIPVYYLSSILEKKHLDDSGSIIIVEYLETLMAIAVDSIEQYENVVVNPLPKILQNMKLLQGVVYDENYAIISILNIPNIMQKMKGLLAYDIKKYDIKNEKKSYTILIVDDSFTTRQIEKTIFETDGYIVETAIDGIDALEKLNEKHIDILVTDISMPRMDGTSLLSNVRRMEEYQDLPVIVVSGAYDSNQEKFFLQPGRAQKFIVKSDFERGNLLMAAKELLNG